MKYKYVSTYDIPVGSILSCIGDRKLARIISKTTGGKVTHTAAKSDVYKVTDSQIDGTRERNEFLWQKRYGYSYYVFRNVNPDFDNYAFVNRLKDKAERRIPYNFIGLAQQWAYHKTGLWLGKSGQDERQFCSQMIAIALGFDDAELIDPYSFHIMLLNHKDWELVFDTPVKVKVKK